MANPHNGEVSISLDHAIRKGLLKPRNRNVHLKYTLGVLGEVETEFKREFQSDTSVFEIMQRNARNPVKTSIIETIILLQYGLRDQFPAMNRDLAGQILEEEDFLEVNQKIAEGLNLAFHGTAAFQPVEEEEFVVESAAEEGADPGAEDAEKN